MTLLAMLVGLAAIAHAGDGRFAPLDPGKPLTFPRDHGSHDDARVEWWYVTGHLERPDGSPLSYQLTFFRTGLADTGKGSRSSAWAPRDLHLAHFARTCWGRPCAFRFAERAHRSGPGAAWARVARLDVANETFRLEDLGGSLYLTARDGDDALSLLLSPEKPMVLHGEGGLSRKGPEREAVSRYVSFTRLASSGYVTSGTSTTRVTGTSWLDHEWGSGFLSKDSAGWDWFAIQLADGRDLMLYRLRGKGGETSRFSSGTLVEKDGRTRTLAVASEVTIEESARWTSPRSGGTYPARWRVRVPSAGLDLEVVPVLADQELVTERSTRVTYWEGACTVSGSHPGKAYVELTGYTGAAGLDALRRGGR